MSDEALEDAEYRLRLERIVLAQQEAYDSTNTAGLVPRPLTADEYVMLLKYFYLADNLTRQDFGKVGPQPLDDDTVISLRAKVEAMLHVEKLLDGTVLYDGDTAAQDVEVITLADAKTRNYPRSDSYPDESDDSIWIVLHIKGSAILQIIYNTPVAVTLNQGFLNWQNIIGCCSTPPAPGSEPPGFVLPPTYTPPTPPSGQERLTLVCASNQIYHLVGTNHVSLLLDYGLSLGLGILNALPVSDGYENSHDIKSAFDTAIASAFSANSISSATAKEVKFCYEYACLGKILFTVMGISALSLQSWLPQLKVHRTDDTTETISLTPTNHYGFSGLHFTIPISGVNFGVTADVDVVTAENHPFFIIKDYDLVDHIYLSFRVLPTMPAGAQDLFQNHETSPDIFLGLADVVYLPDTCFAAILPYSYDASDVTCWFQGPLTSDSHFTSGYSTAKRRFRLPPSATTWTIDVTVQYSSASNSPVGQLAVASWQERIGGGFINDHYLDANPGNPVTPGTYHLNGTFPISTDPAANRNLIVVPYFFGSIPADAVFTLQSLTVTAA